MFYLDERKFIFDGKVKRQSNRDGVPKISMQFMKFHYMTFNMRSQSEIVETNEAKTPKNISSTPFTTRFRVFECIT